ncbi:MAG TPA: hypothetical protein PKE04_09740, partial [Clostridia bacterium]|nr:hypothetical protein [Clostridia bacterium]
MAHKMKKTERRRPALQKGWRRLAASCVSLLCVAVLLAGMVLVNLPVPHAFAAEATLVCGISEHAHTSSCYESQLSCGQEEHHHDQACFDSNGALICS